MHYTNTSNPVDFPKTEEKVMNEQIRELAIKAFDSINAISSEGVADRHTFEQEWFQLYNQRFAELIYKDIITVVAAQALLNESALDVFKNLKRLYEEEGQWTKKF